MEGNSITVGNIEVGRVINKYNYYNDYTENLISPYADEDDFFDSEITEMVIANKSSCFSKICIESSLLKPYSLEISMAYGINKK